MAPLSDHAALAKDQSTTGANVQLQHRHFAFIARTIATLDDMIMREHVADTFGRACGKTNPKFDAARFYKACGLEGF